MSAPLETRTPAQIWEDSLLEIERKSQELSYAKCKDIKDKVDWNVSLSNVRRKSMEMPTSPRLSRVNTSILRVNSLEECTSPANTPVKN